MAGATGSGGRRPGAGRKKGSPNKRTIAKQTAMAASGLSPLEFLLTVMRDDGAEMHQRLDAAKGAAQYTHARLQSISHTGDGGGPIVVELVRYGQ